MVFQELIGIAALFQAHAMLVEVIVIETLIVLEVSLVEATTVDETIPRQEATGVDLLIAALKIHVRLSSFLNMSLF